MGVSTSSSPFAPPRARGSTAWRRPWYWLRRNLQLERFAVRTTRGSVRGLWPCLLMPGAQDIERGLHLTGRALLGVWLALVAAAVLAVGTAWGTSALLGAAVLHAVAATRVWFDWYDDGSPGERLWRACRNGSLVVFGLYGMVAPAVSWMVVRPLRVDGSRVVLINPRVPTSWMSRGDWIAYRLPGGMLGFERVLAFEGETIRFHPEAFEVDGTAYRRLAHSMPQGGTVTIPAGMVFVWPVGARLGGGGEVTEIVWPLATVPTKRVIGRAYDHWPWKRGSWPTLVKLTDWTGPGSGR